MSTFHVSLALLVLAGLSAFSLWLPEPEAPFATRTLVDDGGMVVASRIYVDPSGLT